ncbi:MAG: hypothetical protein RL095_2948 [Verrucomicrobiota bacterium]|jgi:glutamate--cysteine ligase
MKESPADALSFFGAEKESLRCRLDGSLATSPHPAAMGDPLTCPWLTTDFLEAQLEIITTPQASAAELHRELGRLTEACRRMLPADELLWPGSAPCWLGTDEELILARYGEQGEGPRRELYRRGLKRRGGARRQALCGLHLNWSPGPALRAGIPAEEVSRRLVRAAAILSRDSQVLVWIGGASPCLHHSFFGGLEPGADLFDPQACSLRLGSHGYRLEEQDAIVLDYSSPQAWGRSLQAAMAQPHPRPELRRTHDQTGSPLQLGGGLLQTESELYAPVRPKAATRPGESLLQVFAEGRCDWLELRVPDLDPYHSQGCSLEFLEMAELLFLLSWFESEDSAGELCSLADISAPARQVAAHGRIRPPHLAELNLRLQSLRGRLPDPYRRQSEKALRRLEDGATGRATLLSADVEAGCRKEGFLDFHLRRALTALPPQQ